MKKKIIIIIYKELEKFEYEKYGGTIFGQYFDVEIWSLAKIFLNDNVKVQDSFVNQKKIKSLIEYIKCLRFYDTKRTFLFFLLLPGVRMTFYLEMAASLLGFKFSMAYPQPCLSKWNCESLKEHYEKNKTDFLNAFINVLFPPTFNFIATTACYKEFPSPWSIKRQKNILIHTLDYDNFIKKRDVSERLIKDKYILFIDENYIDHNLYQILDITPPFKKPDNYYIPLKCFFDRVEKLLGYKVVIAEHPRANYSDKKIFGEREMIQGETARLIKDAELVLCHRTMALDYIILFQKKFLVIYLNEIMQFYQWESYYIPLFNYLNIKGLNISRPYDDKMIIEAVSSGMSNACKKYKRNYIKSKDTPEKLFFEVVSEYILKL